jgi:uncharacterized protein YceK
MLAREAYYASVPRTARRLPWEKPMHGPTPTRVPLTTALLLAVLSGCTATQHTNASHPGYGDAEYKTDLKQCRDQNSKIILSTGYDDRSTVDVDEDKAQSCMNQRGWQAVSR